MKKEKGFTLIELLAVIVILAIIALIATPIVLNIIDKARASARVSSANGVLEAAKLFYTQSILDSTVVYPTDGLEFVCDGTKCEAIVAAPVISEEGIAMLAEDADVYQLQFSGKYPTGGSIIIKSDGTITINNLAMDSHVCTYDETKKVFTSC